jgi:hypothetical protein
MVQQICKRDDDMNKAALTGTLALCLALGACNNQPEEVDNSAADIADAIPLDDKAAADGDADGSAAQGSTSTSGTGDAANGGGSGSGMGSGSGSGATNRGVSDTDGQPAPAGSKLQKADPQPAQPQETPQVPEPMK